MAARLAYQFPEAASQTSTPGPSSSHSQARSRRRGGNSLGLLSPIALGPKMPPSCRSVVG